MRALTCFSSIPFLSIPDDCTFRLIAGDLVQSDALVKVIITDSAKAIIPIWHNDAYGTGLAQTVTEKFNRTGKVVMPGVEYNI